MSTLKTSQPFAMPVRKTLIKWISALLFVFWTAMCIRCCEGYFVEGIALSPDGAYLAHSNSRGVKVLETKTGSVWITSETRGEAAFSGDGFKVALSGSVGGVVVWDLQSRELIQTLKRRGSPRHLAFGRDGTLLIDYYGRVEIWDLVKQEQLHYATINRRYVDPEAAAKDLSLLACNLGHFNHFEVEVWDPRTESIWANFKGETFLGINGLAFSDDASKLALAGRDGVRVLDLNSKREIAHLKGPALRSVAFLGDSEKLATLSVDGTVGIQTLSGGPSKRLGDVGAGYQGALSFDAEKNLLFAAGEDGKFLSVDLDDESVVKRRSNLAPWSLVPSPVFAPLWGDRPMVGMVLVEVATRDSIDS